MTKQNTTKASIGKNLESEDWKRVQNGFQDVDAVGTYSQVADKTLKQSECIPRVHVRTEENKK